MVHCISKLIYVNKYFPTYFHQDISTSDNWKLCKYRVSFQYVTFTEKLKGYYGKVILKRKTLMIIELELSFRYVQTLDKFSSQHTVPHPVCGELGKPVQNLLEQ